jgi:hypothetical protein
MTDLPSSAPQNDAKERLLALARTMPSATRSSTRTGPWLIGFASVIIGAALYFATNGIEHGTGRALWFYLTCTISWSGVAAVSVWGVLGHARGTNWRPRSVLLLVAAGTPGVLFALMFALAVARPEVTAIHPERLGLKCLGLTLAAAVFPLVSLLYVRRASDPVHPALTGAALGSACGASAGIMVELWCPVAAPAHVAFGHVLPIIVLALLGSGIGARMLRVRRVRHR